MNIIFTLLAVLAVVGCKPNDQHVKTVKERVDAGEVVWFSEAGTKLPNCRNGADWPGLRGTPEDERSRIVLGKQKTVVSPGNRSCYRIGSRVALREKKYGIWQEVTWQDYAAHVRAVSLGLAALGLARGDTVAVISGNRPAWLYVELGLFLFTGIAGTGHHYYWLGAPKAWLWVGGVFSALEPFPILLMLWDAWRSVQEHDRPDRPDPRRSRRR